MIVTFVPNLTAFSLTNRGERAVAHLDCAEEACAAEDWWCPGRCWTPWRCAFLARKVPETRTLVKNALPPSTRCEHSDSQWNPVIWALVADRNPKFCLLVHTIAWSGTWERTKVLPPRTLRAFYTLGFPTEWQAEIQFLMRKLKSQVKCDWAKSKSQIWPLFSGATLAGTAGTDTQKCFISSKCRLAYPRNCCKC